jgi:hypothetical protein
MKKELLKIGIGCLFAIGGIVFASFKGVITYVIVFTLYFVANGLMEYLLKIEQTKTK